MALSRKAIIGAQIDTIDLSMAHANFDSKYFACAKFTFDSRLFLNIFDVNCDLILLT